MAIGGTGPAGADTTLAAAGAAVVSTAALDSEVAPTTIGDAPTTVLLGTAVPEPVVTAVRAPVVTGPPPAFEPTTTRLAGELGAVPTRPGNVPSPPAPGSVPLTNPPLTVPPVTLAFDTTCVPGTWSLSAAAFSAYVGRPSEGRAVLIVEPSGAYTAKGSFTTRIDVGNDSIFTFDAVIDQVGSFYRTVNGFIVLPTRRPGVIISGARAEGTGPAPDGHDSLEPDFTEFLATSVVSCVGTSLLVTSRAPWPQGAQAPATLEFTRA